MEASTSTGQRSNVFPLDFRKTNILQYLAPSKLSLAFSAENPMDHQIILPFVSKGATWISDDEVDDNNDIRDESSQEDGHREYAGHAKDSTALNDSDNDIEEGVDEEEEEDELLLRLPQFVTPQYVQDGADTAIFLFRGGNEARLVRRAARGTMDSMAE
jgi:hypothetical protein